MTEPHNKDLSSMTGAAGTIDFSDMDAICKELAETLACPDRNAPMLRRQAEMMDHLLYAVMKNTTHKARKYNSFSEDWLSMALRIQKQCTDTIKAGAAIDYMQVLASRMEAPPLEPQKAPPVPLPPYHDEQSEGR